MELHPVVENVDSAWQLFVNAIKSSATRRTYTTCLQAFCAFCQVNTPDLTSTNAVLENRIISWITAMKQAGKSYSHINNCRSAVCLFYNVNDRDLRWNKIKRYMPEQTRLNEDRAYTKEELQRLLDIIPPKLKTIVLFLSASGARIGALPELRMKHLEKIENMYKVRFYGGTNDQYYSFLTPEATRQLDLYLDERRASGERLDADSLVFRDSYQRFYNRAVKGPRPISRNGVSVLLTLYAQKIGLRTKGADRQKRKSVQILHGLRKYATTQMLTSGMDPIVVDMILGHRSSVLTQSYFRPSDDMLLNQYKLAVPALSINDATVLKIENASLKKQVKTTEQLEKEFAELKEKLKHIIYKHEL